MLAGGRTLSSSPAPVLATPVPGGSTPAAVHSPIHIKADQAPTGPWLPIAKACCLVAAILAPRSRYAFPEAERADLALPMIHIVPRGGMVPSPLPHQCRHAREAPLGYITDRTGFSIRHRAGL